jgi:hypothetical protein
VGNLISASATTGWTDWIHGELWLLPDGLLRVALSVEETRRHGARRTVPEELVSHSFESRDIAARLANGKRNVWIEADQIARASLRGGIKNDRLKLWLQDGTTVKLLWLSVDPASAHLRPALASWGVQT